MYILILVFVVPVILLVLFANAAKRGTRTGSVINPTTTPAQQNAPLPTKENIVRIFCNLIDEGRISDAVGMMDTTDDTVRQSWGVYLSNFSSFKLVNIKSSSIDETRNSFEVDINVTLKKNLSDLPIPNYPVQSFQIGWLTCPLFALTILLMDSTINQFAGFFRPDHDPPFA